MGWTTCVIETFDGEGDLYLDELRFERAAYHLRLLADVQIRSDGREEEGLRSIVGYLTPLAERNSLLPMLVGYAVTLNLADDRWIDLLVADGEGRVVRIGADFYQRP
jgi:hypothetical protein